MAILYTLPSQWLRYDARALVAVLTDAKAGVLSLTTMPIQRGWVEELQAIQLKREVAGTSRIEGADFTENELEEALQETPEQLLTRSQRQAHAAVKTYRWIASLADDRPMSADLIRKIHAFIVTGADDDHCPPGILRGKDQNVVFGRPRHRGVEGGAECERAFASLMKAVQQEFPQHDLLIQALALHYHFAALHPFLDGNGRTARAVEALMLQRAGLRDSLFIAMSNYYYDEKEAYLATLKEVRERGHDLTPFLHFGLKGIAQQCQRLFREIRRNVSKALYRNVMHDLFKRLESDRKRVLAKRQLKILEVLLERDSLELEQLVNAVDRHYFQLKNPMKALIRDVNQLISLRAITAEKSERGKYRIRLRLEWATEITETAFFEAVKRFPQAKTYLAVS